MDKKGKKFLLKDLYNFYFTTNICGNYVLKHYFTKGTYKEYRVRQVLNLINKKYVLSPCLLLAIWVLSLILCGVVYYLFPELSLYTYYAFPVLFVLSIVYYCLAKKQKDKDLLLFVRKLNNKLNPKGIRWEINMKKR